MPSGHTSSERDSLFTKLGALGATYWVVGFLIVFFRQDMPNTSLSRVEIWELLTTNWLTMLNPLDYSADPKLNAGWQYLGERAPFVATASILLAAAWGMGNLVFRWACSQVQLRTSERLVVTFGTGLSLQSLWVLLCGLAGQLTAYAVLTPGVIAVVISLLALLKKRTAMQTAEFLPIAKGARASKGWVLFFLCMMFPFVLHLFLGGMTPPFDFDVREYHLQGPKEWLLAGRISTLEHNVYTSFPFLSEMLSLAAMVLHGDWWQGAIAGKLTLSLFQLLSALAVFAISRRWIGVASGWIAAAALLSTPWILRISTIAYAEGAITFYLIASVMTALLAAGCERAPNKTKLISLTGFLAGSAMAAKYPGVLSAVLPIGLFLLIIVVTKRRMVPDENAASPDSTNAADSASRRILVNAAVFTAGVLIAVGPWLAKNGIATGNPVYPLAYSVFGANDWSPQMDAKWKNGHSPSEHQLTRIPAHLADVAIRNDWQNGFLFAFAVPAILLVRRNSAVSWLLAHACWLLVTWWFFTHRIDRFWVPLIPIVAVLAGAAWKLSTSIAWKSLTIGALSLCAVFNYGLCRYPTAIGFHSGLIELETVRKLPIRDDIKLLNTILDDNVRLLSVGEAEVFDIDRDIVYNTVFDESIFQEWTSAQPGYEVPADEQTMKSAQEIRTILQQNGITHILVNWSEILRYRQTYGYTKYVFPERFVQLQRLGVLEDPVPLSHGRFSKLSDQNQREVRSWKGSAALIGEADNWTNVQLFRLKAQ